MKILILSTSEKTGGAAIAANRLLQALNKAGHEAKMLVRDKQTDNPNVVSINTSWWMRKLSFVRFAYERWVIFVYNRFSRKNLFQVSIANTGADISKHPLVKSADIIHIHWINQGFLSLRDIKKLTNTGKPVVWTMHDLWTGTGICHYPCDCEKYKNKCQDCFLLSRYFPLDLARQTLVKKEKANLHSICYVGCSLWIAEKAKQSSLLKNAKITSISNPINTGIFYYRDKLSARKKFGLPENKKLLLFSAAKISDTRKGGIYFQKACNLICEADLEWKNNVEIILMGSGDEKFLSGIKMKVNMLSYVSGDENIAAIYATADVFVIPSLEDNLPNTIMEAMACGIPCVGFNTGGIPEMIDHKENGYVVKYKDAEDLAAGIEWVLNNTAAMNLPEACIKKVQNNYTQDIVADKYTRLYESLLS